MRYPFADRAAEDERLIAQGRLFDPLTRRLLRQAGLAPGMRVLDLGSGAARIRHDQARSIADIAATVADGGRSPSGGQYREHGQCGCSHRSGRRCDRCLGGHRDNR
jgi:hypothetical protein